MKAIRVQSFGGEEVLELVECDTPSPEAGEVLVRVSAIGVNPVETYIRAGTYPLLPSLPYTPGGNMAGTVIGCGAGVEQQWLPGDRVYSASTRTGAYAEYAVCAADQVFPLPDIISFQQGAALGIPAATAWRGLFIRGGGRTGERVLVHGASGSVGQAALQMARAAGMEVYGTAGTDEGLSLLQQLGARAAFNHRNQGYVEEMKEKVAGGFDLILEMLANVNLERDLDLLAPKGRVVIIGSRGRIEIDPRATMGKETDIRGLSGFACTSEEMARTYRAIGLALEDGSLVPIVSREMPLAKAPEAHRLVMQSGNCGKIVLIL